MGGRWRQENLFRYARMHLELDSHDSYTSTNDDEQCLVPNPANAKSYQKVLAARKYHQEVAVLFEAPLTDLQTPLLGAKELNLTVTNTMHNKTKEPL